MKNYAWTNGHNEEYWDALGKKEIVKVSLPNAIQLAYQCLELAIIARENWIKKVKEAMHPTIYE